MAQRKYKSSYIYSSLEFEDKDSHQLLILMPSTGRGLRKSANFCFSVCRWSHIPSVPTRELDSAVCDFTLGLKVTHKALFAPWVPPWPSAWGSRAGSLLLLLPDSAEVSGTR